MKNFRDKLETHYNNENKNSPLRNVKVSYTRYFIVLFLRRVLKSNAQTYIAERQKKRYIARKTLDISYSNAESYIRPRKLLCFCKLHLVAGFLATLAVIRAFDPVRGPASNETFNNRGTRVARALERSNMPNTTVSAAALPKVVSRMKSQREMIFTK